MSSSSNSLPPEIAAAYKEAKSRGLPDGWTCTIDKRNRRKWTAPNNGRSCDSIPKALAISVDLGLLPPDTKIAAGPNKRKRPSNKTPSSSKRGRKKKEPEAAPVANFEAQEEEVYEDVADPLDPEHALDINYPRIPSAPVTVHWDPKSPDGRKIGWKVRIAYDGWSEGRIVKYDPYTHKHKLVLKSKKEAWIWIRNDQHNLHIATRMVWAHVKGYAWWPALVMESSRKQKPGFVQVEFFGSGEVSNLRDSPECIRPFSPGTIDPVVAKHRKKRNAKAFQLACDEFNAIRKCRRLAAIWYAEKAANMADDRVGRAVQFFRPKVNYPSGATVKGKVRKYSPVQRKWLVAYDDSRYEASWENLNAKDCNLQVLDNKKRKVVDNEGLVPFLYGYETGDAEDPWKKVLTEHCRACVKRWKPDDIPVACEDCNASFHLSCMDPPLALESWQRLVKEGTPILCSTCTPCRGCYQKDLCFGSHPLQPRPVSLSLERDESLDLCHPCRKAYEDERFCPNCAHTWDDVRFQQVKQQMERTTKSRKSLQDDDFPLVLGSFAGDEILPAGGRVNPIYYYPETPEWGFTEIEMLVCDACKVWVHAGCAGISQDEYDLTSDGKHEIYSKEFLCRMCCRERCKMLIKELQKEDKTMLFAEPVNERVAPNYRDVIKIPMDLQTMMEKAEQEEYLNYAWVREHFELMVLNALTFNRFYTKVWNEAKRYYNTALNLVFNKIGKAAPPGKYEPRIKHNFQKAEQARKNEADRVQVDESVEKKDLVAGSMAKTVTLPVLRDSPPDQSSCVPYKEVDLTPVDAFYTSWMDSCFTCGSSGASDTMLFCVDCGEAFHSFCANAPIHSMEPSSVAGWRCPNCKICEISGVVPQDETRMVYCEMCDRAFCLDLLDPPLSSAPSGLWICGQCVECKDCRNTSEKASLLYWSRFPDKCYRCHGCEGVEGLVFEKCGICQSILRADDSDIEQCNGCQTKIHICCDQGASDHRMALEMASRTKQAKYFCPSCSQTSTGLNESMEEDKSLLRSLVSWAVEEGGVFSLAAGDSTIDLQLRLTEALNWQTRNLWRDEYLAVIESAMKLFVEAHQVFADPRRMVQVAFTERAGVLSFKAQRAMRFVVLVKRRKLAVRGFKLDQKIESILLMAKLAAAFVEVACLVMEKDVSALVSQPDRLRSLTAPPTDPGIFEAPVRAVRCSRLPNTDGIAALGIPAGGSISAPLITSSSETGAESEQMASVAKEDASVTMAKPLQGWADQIPGGHGQSKWKDSRECCLCHIHGDDEGGYLDEPEKETREDEVTFSGLGRLLPMSDGYWVHTACALWSSEVWEAPDDGVVHAIEKARSRGSQLKCFGCGLPGATVGCCKSNCPFNYHFPCAKVCGAVFSGNQRVYCSNHRSAATDLLTNESFEHMKTLMINPEKKVGVETEASSDLCVRVGALTAHSLGQIDPTTDKFHSENYITPHGYVATRIFWSAKEPRERTVYILKVEKANSGSANFVIIPGDDASSVIEGGSLSSVYNTLMDRVRKVNAHYFSQGDLLSKLPAIRRTRKKTFGLNGPQFFGFGLDHIRRRLESSPGVEAVVSPLNPDSPDYRFCFVLPEEEALLFLHRKRAAMKAERALENSSGCARTEGIKAVTRSGGSGRITRALVRSAEEVTSSSSTAKRTEDKRKADRNLYQVKYRLMKSVPITDRLVARRSHIHGWGLFTKIDIPKDDPIVEYMGEIIRQPIGDKRERGYEISGEGSCYMFRLDFQRIVDATKIGSMARFMNHSCQENAYAKIISVDTEQGQDKKIVVFANRNISAGEEITYDYKFPVEDGSLRCMCGAPNCIGRLN